MRRVEHLPAVELIHDLYNQYDFRINAVRFRNTVTIWRGGVVNSYAPVFEWEAIAAYLGDKFYRLDPLLINELNTLYDSERTFVSEYLDSIDLATLSDISSSDLRNILLNIQNFTLGDLYRLNFVQVEHALTSALYRELEELGIDRQELSSLIVTEYLTEFQKEEVAFAKMVQQLAGKSKESVEMAVQEHWDAYAHMHCAYGELPYPIEYYSKKFENFDAGSVRDIEQEIRFAAKVSEDKVVAIGSSRLTELVGLMKRGGVFRDNNKARLGQTMRYKFAVLDEISRRMQVERSMLSFYSVHELCDLLDSEKRVDDDVLIERKEKGVVLVRSENYSAIGSTGAHTDVDSILRLLDGVEVDVPARDSSDANSITLEGLGASPGHVSGTARIVYSYEDGHKVNDGDIMIAIGTDFDLMDAIQRSAAVVTEEGGFLSHASVVCREMKKPCCIGVEDATQLIADGDKVEVDANKGVLIVTKHEAAAV